MSNFSHKQKQKQNRQRKKDTKPQGAMLPWDISPWEELSLARPLRSETSSIKDLGCTRADWILQVSEFWNLGVLAERVNGLGSIWWCLTASPSISVPHSTTIVLVARDDHGSIFE